MTTGTRVPFDHFPAARRVKQTKQEKALAETRSTHPAATLRNDSYIAEISCRFDVIGISTHTPPPPAVRCFIAPAGSRGYFFSQEQRGTRGYRAWVAPHAEAPAVLTGREAGVYRPSALTTLSLDCASTA